MNARTPLPREYDQHPEPQRPMLTPPSGIYGRGLAAICSVRGCGHVAEIEGMCFGCHAEYHALQQHWRKRNEPTRAARLKHHVEIAKNIFWIVLFMILVGLLAWSLFPYFYATWQLWKSAFVPGGN
ncbi:MAG: hypothetical protein KGL39_43195 [Patescibacteria group bacterium]|nr:hypothetical protein [Patescibacteria group bacterium]